MRFYQLFEDISELTWNKDKKFKYPSVIIDVHGVKFVVLCMFENIVWKVETGNLKKWNALKSESDISFLKDVAPLLEKGVYKLLSYLNDFEVESNFKERKISVRPRMKYTLFGNTKKAAELYRTWNNPPFPYYSEPSNKPREQGIIYFKMVSQ